MSVHEKVARDVATYGWHVLNVLPEGDHPPHAFTVGLFRTFQHAEIVVFGLPGDTAHGLLNVAAEAIRCGKRFEAGSRHSDIIEVYDVVFVEVSREHYSEYLGTALGFYHGQEFPVLQLVWPDRTYMFPWEEAAAPWLKAAQPLLNPPTN